MRAYRLSSLPPGQGRRGGLSERAAEEDNRGEKRGRAREKGFIM